MEEPSAATSAKSSSSHSPQPDGVVSLDAMGCQKKTAITIHHARADYRLALKGNRGTLHGDVRELFNEASALQRAKASGALLAKAATTDKGHGRAEERDSSVTGSLVWLDGKERRSWLDLRSLVHMRSVRLHAEGSRSEQDRYWLV